VAVKHVDLQSRLDAEKFGFDGPALSDRIRREAAFYTMYNNTDIPLVKTYYHGSSYYGEWGADTSDKPYRLVLVREDTAGFESVESDGDSRPTEVISAVKQSSLIGALAMLHSKSQGHFACCQSRQPTEPEDGTPYLYGPAPKYATEYFGLGEKGRASKREGLSHAKSVIDEAKREDSVSEDDNSDEPPPPPPVVPRALDILNIPEVLQSLRVLEGGYDAVMVPAIEDNMETGYVYSSIHGNANAGAFLYKSSVKQELVQVHYLVSLFLLPSSSPLFALN
jgi:hypothetical protein